MLFTFKRDEEGRERIYVGDALVGAVRQSDGGAHIIDTGGVYDPVPGLEHDTSASVGVIEDAYGYADEAGFWSRRKQWSADIPIVDECGPWIHNEIAVDVFVPTTSTSLSVTTPGDTT